jgi:murein DD-endopeptidase MepM/ murein hydrolase activator NlpD
VYISYDSSLRIYSLTFAVMKPYKVLLFAIALLTASTAFAQFNTVSHDTPRYKVSVKSATQPTPRLPDASAPSATPYSDSLQTSQQKKRIDQRQGVAYPLKHIQVTSPFGYRHDPFTGKKRMHNGLDLHARSDKVFAMLHGIVHKVGYDKCFGIFVTLRHGDITVSYCHLSKVTVRKGDVVYAGTVVGITGNTGRSTGEHLHITCKLKGKHVDPITMLHFFDHYLK